MVPPSLDRQVDRQVGSNQIAAKLIRGLDRD